MKLFRSFGFAWEGIVYAYKTQQNFRIHLLVLLLVIVSGLLLRITKTEWLAILVCAMLMLALELLNTAIEYLCDIVSPEFHPGIKIIKDVTAAAVLICAIGSVVTGIVIFLPRIVALAT